LVTDSATCCTMLSVSVAESLRRVASITDAGGSIVATFTTWPDAPAGTAAVTV
jgi:hypothetical protein